MKIKKIQDEIGAWAEKTFPEETLTALFVHLVEEIGELSKSDFDEEELADCAILILNMAHLRKINLGEAIKMKMKVNKCREWGEPDKQNIVRHMAKGRGGKYG